MRPVAVVLVTTPVSVHSSEALVMLATNFAITGNPLLPPRFAELISVA